MTRSEFKHQTQKNSCGTYLILGILILCLLGTLSQCITNLQEKAVDPQKQEALEAVQNQDTAIASNMHESIAVVLVILENEGHTHRIDGWSASKGNGYYSVKFYFYLDGSREYAEWWYYPGKKLVIPKNDWAYTFMGE